MEAAGLPDPEGMQQSRASLLTPLYLDFFFKTGMSAAVEGPAGLAYGDVRGRGFFSQTLLLSLTMVFGCSKSCPKKAQDCRHSGPTNNAKPSSSPSKLRENP